MRERRARDTGLERHMLPITVVFVLSALSASFIAKEETSRSRCWRLSGTKSKVSAIAGGCSKDMSDRNLAGFNLLPTGQTTFPALLHVSKCDFAI
jgi:hypothetical protein